MSELDRDARRRQIIDAVVRITTNGGLQAASFRTVAKEAGVSVRLVQYYFGTKDQLLVDTLREVGKDAAVRIDRALRELGSDPSPKAKIGTLLEQFLPSDDERRDTMLVIIALRTASLTDPSLRGSEELGLGTSLIGIIEAELDRAVKDGDTRPGLNPHLEAIMLVATVSGVANEMLAGGLSDLEGRESLRYVVDLAIPS